MVINRKRHESRSLLLRRHYLFHQLKLLTSSGRLSWMFDRWPGALSAKAEQFASAAPDIRVRAEESESESESPESRFDPWRCLALLVLGVHPVESSPNPTKPNPIYSTVSTRDPLVRPVLCDVAVSLIHVNLGFIQLNLSYSR